MSFLRIAAVTHVLKRLLKEPSGITVINGLEVTTLLPHKMEGGAVTADQINLYMYMPTYNQGWKNHALPSMDSNARKVSNPPLVLDLHYMLSTYAPEEIGNELNAEMLLGYGMQIFHEYPVVSRAFISEQLSDDGTLTGKLSLLKTAGLSKQIEQIKISPDTLSTEEITRLWSAFGTKHRPCAFYKVTAVMLEKDKPTRVALPVKKYPFPKVIQFSPPIITSISSRNSNTAPIIENQKIFSSSQLVINGTQLKGEITEVVVGGTGIDTSNFIESSDTRIIVPIPVDLGAGIHSVKVVHKIKLSNPPDRRGFTSNAEAIVLSPSKPTDIIKDLQNQGNEIYSGSIKLKFKPLPREEQQTTLILNNLDINSPISYTYQREYSDLTIDNDVITIPIEEVKKGEYLIRIMIDNAISPVEIDNNNKQPSLNIP